MLFTKRNFSTALEHIKHLRGLAIGITALVFCAALLAAQTAPEVKIVV